MDKSVENSVQRAIDAVEAASAALAKGDAGAVSEALAEAFDALQDII